MGFSDSARKNRGLRPGNVRAVQASRGAVVLFWVSVSGAGLGDRADLGNGTCLQPAECGLCDFSGLVDLSPAL